MISDDIRKLFASSSVNSNQELLKTIEAIQSLGVGLDDLIFNQPDTYDLGYLTTYDMEEISKFSNGLPREFRNFNLFENLYFLSFTQIKQLLKLYQSLIKDEKYYASIIVLRSLLEVVAFTSYPLSKAEGIMPELGKILNNSIKTKSHNEKSRLSLKYSEKTYAIFESVYDSFHSGGDFLTKNMSTKYGIDISSAPPKKTVHIHDALKELDKKSKQPVWELYEMLSQCAHPNIGSRLLMIESSAKHFSGMDKMTISSSNKSKEGTIYYYEQFSEGLLLTLQLTLALTQRFKTFLDTLNSLFEYSNGSKRNVIH